IPKIEIQEKDVAIGVAFIQQMTKPFRATQYRDTYKEELLHMIQEKVKGKEQKITKKQKPKPTKNEELIPLLEKSLHREKIQ
ncbi:MAG TPA: hypothetical protein VJB65_02365, partial [Patescibacteria group bacterium]|nr:hypothetical protein [Patescibacteria group bacterium]